MQHLLALAVATPPPQGSTWVGTPQGEAMEAGVVSWTPRGTPMGTATSWARSQRWSPAARPVAAGGRRPPALPVDFRQHSERGRSCQAAREVMTVSCLGWRCHGVVLEAGSRKQTGTRVRFFSSSYLLCFHLGSSSANSSPEFTRKDYGNYCECERQPHAFI